MKLLVATGNPGKMAEYQGMLGDLDMQWLSLRDVGLDHMDVAETGATFEANARIKVEAYGKASGLLTLADDSGLVVDALDGAPGVYSARYGAPQVTSDEGRYQKLLSQLQDVPQDDRTARFVCVVAICAPGGEITSYEGRVEGRIAQSPRGDNGFGYDPVFLVGDGAQTMAELSAEEKNRISHRANALAAAQPFLLDLITQ